MKDFLSFIEHRYCRGISINVDMFWNDSKKILEMGGFPEMEKIIKNAAAHAKMKIIDERLTKYGDNQNFGYTYLVVLAQSHCVIHTWPEFNMMNVDIFTCGEEGDSIKMLEHIIRETQPYNVKKNQVERGIRKDIDNANEPTDSPKDLIKAKENG